MKRRKRRRTRRRYQPHLPERQGERPQQRWQSYWHRNQARRRTCSGLALLPHLLVPLERRKCFLLVVLYHPRKKQTKDVQNIGPDWTLASRSRHGLQDECCIMSRGVIRLPNGATLVTAPEARKFRQPNPLWASNELVGVAASTGCHDQREDKRSIEWNNSAPQGRTLLPCFR